MEITAFMPTNDAFDAISEFMGTLSIHQLQSVLLLHLVPEEVDFSPDIPRGQSAVTSALGQNVILNNNNNGGIFANNAEVILPNVIFQNGVGHIING